MDPLKAGLAHEQYVTSLIHAIYEAAYEAGISAPCSFWTGS